MRPRHSANARCVAVDKKETLERVRQVLTSGLVPQNTALNLDAVECDVGMVVMKLPYDEKLVGNPERGILHGGAITTMLDAACGMSVFLKMTDPRRIATIDLRIDYMASATPKRDVLCRAECIKLTRSVAFTRAVAYHDTPDDPIASAVGTFMIFSDDKSPTQVVVEADE